jgi:hypothetical protein
MNDVVDAMIQAEKARIRKLYGTKSPKQGLIRMETGLVKTGQEVRKEE